MTALPRGRRRTAGGVLVALLAVLPVVACSTGEDSPDAVPSDAADENAIPEAREAMEQLVERPTTIPVTEPIDAEIPTGLTIDWIECGVPECTVLTEPLTKAAETLGWELKVVPAGLTPETILDAWNVAVRDQPDGVIGSGFPRVLFEQPLAQLEAAGIPVVYGFVTDEAGGGIVAMINVTESFFNTTGVALADFVLGTAGTEANTLFIAQSTFPGAVKEAETFQTRYEELCPDCGFQVMDPPASATGSTLTGDIVAEITRNPDINYVVTTTPSQLTGLPQALETAGLDVRLLTNSPDPTAVQYLKDGLIEGIMMSTQHDAMWQMIDAMARHHAGVDVAPAEAATPNWVVTQETAGELTEPYHLVPGYEDQYKELWGVS